MHTFTMCPQTALKFKWQQGKLCFCLLQIHMVALFPHGAEMYLCTIYLLWLSLFLLSPFGPQPPHPLHLSLQLVCC